MALKVAPDRRVALVPISLGGVLGHQRLVKPLLDIADEAVRRQLGEVEGLYRHRCEDLPGPSVVVKLHLSAPSP